MTLSLEGGGSNFSRTKSPTAALDSSLKPFFTGLAINREAGNEFDTPDLEAAVQKAGSDNFWYYNWKAMPDVDVPAGAQFLAMVKHPGDGHHLPPAGANGVGYTVLGWNEPDDYGQAGANLELL